SGLLWSRLTLISTCCTHALGWWLEVSLTAIGSDSKMRFGGQNQDQFRCPRRARPRRADPAAQADRDLAPGLHPRRAAAARRVAAALAGAGRRPRRLPRRR